MESVPLDTTSETDERTQTMPLTTVTELIPIISRLTSDTVSNATITVSMLPSTSVTPIRKSPHTLLYILLGLLFLVIGIVIIVLTLYLLHYCRQNPRLVDHDSNVLSRAIDTNAYDRSINETNQLTDVQIASKTPLSSGIVHDKEIESLTKPNNRWRTSFEDKTF